MSSHILQTLEDILYDSDVSLSSLYFFPFHFILSSFISRVFSLFFRSRDILVQRCATGSMAGVQFPAGAGDLFSAQTDPGARPASHPGGSAVHFSRGKVAGTCS
jgi:hypothetical protein